ncbi:MAG: hypothetical protein AAFR11_08110 [Pseudomonadota bacterium]
MVAYVLLVIQVIAPAYIALRLAAAEGSDLFAKKAPKSRVGENAMATAASRASREDVFEHDDAVEERDESLASDLMSDAGFDLSRRGRGRRSGAQ